VLFHDDWGSLIPVRVSSKFSWFGADLEHAHHHELDIVSASQLGFWSVLSASV
jgi:hypothetical protein